MPEHTLGIFDAATGRLVLDSEAPGAVDTATDVADVLGSPLEVGCARPATVLPFPPQPAPEQDGIRVSGYWHDDFMVGPGRRSVLRMQGCPIRCVGCWVPETWDTGGGQLVSVHVAAAYLLDHKYERDGVTILGGEPFAQPAALYALLRNLRVRDPHLHIVVYTGYTLERLQAQSYAALDEINVLIDGPYVAALASAAGPWTGSGNQRVHVLRTERNSAP